MCERSNFDLLYSIEIPRAHTNDSVLFINQCSHFPSFCHVMHRIHAHAFTCAKKIKLKTEDKTFTAEQLQQTKQSISQLRSALGNNNQTYKDKNGNVMVTSSSANRKAYEKQLEYALKDEEKLSNKINTLDSTIAVLSEQKLEKESNAELAGELGPLKYIAKLTGYPMDKIINWFLLIIIFVFDPLAIALVIAANFAFAQLRKPEQLSIYNEKPLDVVPQEEPIYNERPNPTLPPNVASFSQPEEKPIPPPTESFSFIPPIFRRKRNEDDTITYN